MQYAPHIMRRLRRYSPQSLTWQAPSRCDDLSAILRGAILTVDVLLAAPKLREAMKHDLRLLAVGSGA
jgi:hypothetical protein